MRNIDGGSACLQCLLCDLYLRLLETLFADFVMTIRALLCFILERSLAHVTGALVVVSSGSFWDRLGLHFGSFRGSLCSLRWITRALGTTAMLTTVALLVMSKTSVAAMAGVPHAHSNGSLYPLLWFEALLWWLVHIVEIVLR